MLLKQYAANGGPEQREVIQLIEANCPLLPYLQFFTYPSRSHNLSADGDIATEAQFRNLGDDYTVKDDYSPVEVAFALKIFGKDLTVDQAYLEGEGLPGGTDPAQAVGAALGVQRRRFARNLGKNLSYYLIDGNSSVDTKQFNGLRQLVSGLPATQTLDYFGESGLQVLDGNDNTAKKSQQKLVRGLRKLIRSVGGGAQCIVMADEGISMLTTIADEAVQVTTDEFGRQITTFDRIPLVSAGFKPDGSDILGFDETLGTSEDCTSVYAFRSEEMAYLSFKTTPGGVRVYDPVHVGNKYEQKVELQVDSGCFNNKSIAVLPGFRIG